ncbi:hypothetical protein IT6_07555 [Methylacidiphilum caldifontis]|nr:hypothetical protein [Methylacidiphilum caldifontis]QSR88237.1 hypothetical protein IT6_07555 [Methylacidiphilum caldifontis]
MPPLSAVGISGLQAGEDVNGSYPLLTHGQVMAFLLAGCIIPEDCSS